MSEITFHKLSWNQYVDDCLELATTMKDVHFDKIVAISRGGLIPARIFSDLLDTAISHMTISSYSGFGAVKEPYISEVPLHSFEDKTILIIDEVSDSGKTFQRATSYFNNFPVKKVYTLSPYIKPRTKFIPDFWIKNIDSWIIFPYDLRETKESFIKMYGDEKSAVKKLLEVGFTKKEVAILEKL
ncbi:hypothetical protein HGB07_02895 [Candidatus Roizmanbacteria bacterium]|nr:hypothetical protein [Candidatus Roizmanbacteria bacterium]